MSLHEMGDLMEELREQRATLAATPVPVPVVSEDPIRLNSGSTLPLGHSWKLAYYDDGWDDAYGRNTVQVWECTSCGAEANPVRRTLRQVWNHIPATWVATKPACR